MNINECPGNCSILATPLDCMVSLSTISYSQFSFLLRSSILTGKYVHNHRTYENSVASGCNAPSWRQLNEQRTVGAYLTTAGYHTGFFGKEQTRLHVCLNMI